ncbi:MAG: LutB/LldF family L-lactate oxidation iron-sulfur protein [candidate division KSB1 bacterium]|nr:LutB/LldF family L-lactate oxidation iron-sulfur protein [candidate division KSB1 bacterium]
MRSAVSRAASKAVEKRNRTAGEYPYWQTMREQAHAVKRRVMENLDDFLLQFEEKCRENGIRVHWAQDAEEARETVGTIAAEHGVKQVVKSKSLTTEEIGLNRYLQKNQIEVTETDLGEYIVQLLDQIPSHLTAPALHLDRKDIGRVFHEKLGVDYTEEPAELLAIARQKLRKKMLNADMGITGVNFAIADSGCLCVVENEANARLSLGVPDVHVAVMGIEKIIPSFSELDTFLKLLPASATGQKQTVYVDVVGGPLFPAIGEGARNVHVIILDNGRSRILADPQLRETLFCIRCGACLNICPVYRQIGGHAYGWVYMGPIGACLIPQYNGISAGRHAPFISSLCGACAQQCPVQISIPHHLTRLRYDVAKQGYTAWWERYALKLHAFLCRYPLLYRALTWFPGKLQQLLPGDMRFPAPGYTRDRALGRFDSKGFRRRFLKMQRQQDL